jgi:hypothetical protein
LDIASPLGQDESGCGKYESYTPEHWFSFSVREQDHANRAAVMMSPTLPAVLTFPAPFALNCKGGCSSLVITQTAAKKVGR